MGASAPCFVVVIASSPLHFGEVTHADTSPKEESLRKLAGLYNENAKEKEERKSASKNAQLKRQLLPKKHTNRKRNRKRKPEKEKVPGART